MDLTLGVSMIVRNEEACLASCLQSVRGADELVIVDTGSTDGTKEIAASFGAKIYDFPWCDDFAAARNYSLAQCTGNWIYVIDADEELEPGGMEKIRAAATEAERLRYLTVYVRTISKTDGTEHWSQRLFKRCPEVYWCKPIHNHLSITEGKRADIKHYYGYSEAHKRDPDRALRILTSYVEKHPDAVRERYYLAREYEYRKNYTVAAALYAEYLTKATWAPEMADAWLKLSRCLHYTGETVMAKDACLQAIGINADFEDAFRFMAVLSGPKNRDRWLSFAATANNQDVLFAPKKKEAV